MNVQQKKRISQFIQQLQEFEQFMRDTADDLSNKIESHSELWQNGDIGHDAGSERDEVVAVASKAEALCSELAELVGE
jgi:hypothetical protein